MADEKTTVTTQTVETQEKPKRTRKKREPKAAKPKGGNDVELEFSEDEENDLPPDHVHLEGKVLTINGDAKLRVMTLDEQKKHGIVSISGEMGKKAKKSPVVVTFKNPKAAAVFFDLCCYAEDETEEFIDTGSKVEWDAPSLRGVMM